MKFVATGSALGVPYLSLFFSFIMSRSDWTRLVLDWSGPGSLLPSPPPFSPFDSPSSLLVGSRPPSSSSSPHFRRYTGPMNQMFMSLNFLIFV
jgi:hypothetical protein